MFFEEEKKAVAQPAIPRSDSLVMQEVWKGKGPKYEIEIDFNTVIGSGGQGRIYKATILIIKPENEGIERFECVAKVLHQEPFNPADLFIENQEIFIHELMSRSGQPSSDKGILNLIGKYMTIDENGDVDVYAIMPLCNAILSGCKGAFEQLKKEDPVFFQPIFFELFNSLINSLHHLKINKVAHRDIKPANIGFRHRWCLLDFGISALCDENGHPTVPVSGYSLKYSAPEQKSMDSDASLEQLNLFAGDIYSIGVVLREFFEASTQQDAPTDDLHVVIETNGDQRSLMSAIEQCTTFNECIEITLAAMTKLSPQERPTLETLQQIEKYLFEFIKGMRQQPDRISEFYSHITTVVKQEEKRDIEHLSEYRTEEIFPLKAGFSFTFFKKTEQTPLMEFPALEKGVSPGPPREYSLKPN